MIEFVIVRYEIRNKFVIFRQKTRAMQLRPVIESVMKFVMIR